MGYEHSRGKKTRGSKVGTPQRNIDKVNSIRKKTSGGRRK